MIRSLLLITSILLFSGCTNLQVAKLDPKTKRFPTEEKATIIKSKKINLDAQRSLLLLPEDEFMQGQVKNIHYFNKTITFDELQTAIVKNNLTNKIPSLVDKISLSKVAKYYRPFLWLRVKLRRTTKNGLQKIYAQFILTNPRTLEDYFIAEKELDYVWAGVNDQNTWYPLFNALVDYIEQNSRIWKYKK